MQIILSVFNKIVYFLLIDHLLFSVIGFWNFIFSMILKILLLFMLNRVWWLFMFILSSWFFHLFCSELRISGRFNDIPFLNFLSFTSITFDHFDISSNILELFEVNDRFLRFSLSSRIPHISRISCIPCIPCFPWISLCIWCSLMRCFLDFRAKGNFIALVSFFTVVQDTSSRLNRIVLFVGIHGRLSLNPGIEHLFVIVGKSWRIHPIGGMMTSETMSKVSKIEGIFLVWVLFPLFKVVSEGGMPVVAHGLRGPWLVFENRGKWYLIVFHSKLNDYILIINPTITFSCFDYKPHSASYWPYAA